MAISQQLPRGRRRFLSVVAALVVLVAALVVPGRDGAGAVPTAAGLVPVAAGPGPMAAGVAQAAPTTAPGSVASVAGAVSSAGGVGSQAGVAAVGAPRVLGEAVILADEATGQVLFERNPDVPRAMASTTKVMTALLALERLDERRVVVIGPGPPQVGEESLRLRRGERLTVRQLLLGLLVKSANDAGVALAEAVDGSEAAFVRRMNRKAAALGLGATRYVTPYGLDRPGHQTSARDLARLWEVAMRRADFRSLVATRSVRLPGVPLSLRRFVTTNQLLGSYRWTVGGKTGFTNRAGRCLVASASRGGRRLVAVALGSSNAFADVQALFEYGFSKFVRARLAVREQPVAVAPGRQASLQAGADVDALVRLDRLGQVRLSLGRASTGGVSGVPASGWFTVGQRRLARVPLARLPAGASPAATLPPPGPSAAGVAPTTAAPGAEGQLAVLTAGAAVPVRPVPPGSPAPTIDPTLRRDPP